MGNESSSTPEAGGGGSGGVSIEEIQKMFQSMCEFADPDIRGKPTELSGYDAKYLSGGHGGNPTHWKHMPPSNYVIELKDGDNDVPLLPCSSVHQIRTITVTPPTTIFNLNKLNFSKAKSKSYTGNDLMQCRTLLVPYKDTYVYLTIRPSQPCKIVINPNKIILPSK